MTETTLRKIEILTNAWDTISNMWIRDEELSKKQRAILDELTELILNEVDLYLKLEEKT